MRRWVWSRGVGILALAAWIAAGAAGTASGDAIPYFNGPGQIGFDNSSLGLPPGLLIQAQEGLVGLDVKQKVKKVKKTGGAFEVSLKLKIKNQSGEAREDLLLLLSALARPSAVAPGSEVELELAGGKIPFDIVILDDGSFERFFAGLAVGDLGSGKKVKTTLLYRVLGDLDARNPSTLTLTAGGASTVIPEPDTALLVGLGLLSLGVRSRVRRRRGALASRPLISA